MKVIASLTIVPSADVSDAATLSIVALALATLIAGVFFIGHNLWDLREYCYKGSSSQQKYKELLKEITYFPLHAFFAILSFLVFRMVLPVAYRYAFHYVSSETGRCALPTSNHLTFVRLTTRMRTTKLQSHPTIHKPQ